ncbi:SulP family inorganic anion transporter [Blastococcus sp. SYSU D00669]
MAVVIAFTGGRPAMISAASWAVALVVAPSARDHELQCLLAAVVLGDVFQESLMTAQLVDDLTDTHSDKTRESLGQGIANMVTGFFGAMSGCAMIGQTMINVRSRARTRLSTFLAGALLLVRSTRRRPSG